MEDLSKLPAKQFLTEILSGLIISILLIPEAVAFSLILGLSPSIGIQSTMILSLFNSLFGGQPGLISGASAAVATSILGVATFIGKEFIPLTVLIGGILQGIIGLTGLYKIIDVMPNGVVSGFMTGLALLILKGEFESFKGGDGKFFTGDMLAYTVLLTIIGLTVVVYGDIETYIRIPGALSSIIILSISLVLLPAIKVQKVGDRGNIETLFPKLQIPNMNIDFAKMIKLLPYSLAMAIAGTTESLFNLRRVGEELNNKGDSFRETMVQGVGNILCGFTNGMGGCVLGGPTRFNLANGAKTRVSGITAAIFFILFSSVFFKFIDNIPMPAIIAIMFVVVFKTGDWMNLIKMPDLDWTITIITTLSSYLSGNLALGVFIGFISDMVFKKTVGIKK
jgi:SulP family sulfate permease